MRVVVLGNYMNAHFIHVDRLPRAGESLAARRVFQEHGGKGLNLGVGLHRLGAAESRVEICVDMLMAVGRDEAGASVRRALAAEGMAMDQVLELGETSGFGVGFIAPDGSNFLAAHLGANAMLLPVHVDAIFDDIFAAGAVPGWVLGHFEVPLAVLRHAFAKARGQGTKTYLNPSPWQPLDADFLGLVDVLVVNETEAAGLFGLDVVPAWSRAEWAAQLLALVQRVPWRGEVLVVTLGDAGSVALDDRGAVHAAAAPKIDQVDATGAGDAFGCGLVWALAQGQSVQRALETGNACGAYIAAREGILAHLPRPGDLKLSPA
ncbi:MAG: PfkB family carbohydrate kinase [Pseudomonadota bacterium]